VVDFPTLGDLLDGWIEAHCRVPDGFLRRQPFRQYDWQFWCVANHYRVRPDAEWIPERPLLNQAFVYRRSQWVGTQKTGKGPGSAAVVAAEAVGPSVFAGWAKRGDRYECQDNGCSCGWRFTYAAGEPMGMRHPSPLIQCTAFSQEQVDNVWRSLTAMIYLGPLKEQLLVRENFIRVVGDNADDPDMDRIDAVTSSAQSRLGNPISFAEQDETGLWTKTNKMDHVATTQRRGLAGMGGRSIETTNPWNPAEESVAQNTWESQAPDVFKFYRIPPRELNFHDKRQRRKMLEFNYAGCDHISIDSIMAECDELMEKDPALAERFFGGRVVSGKGAWIKDGVWDDAWAGYVAS